MDSSQIPMKRTIEEKFDNFYKVHRQKQRSSEVKIFKKLTPCLVLKYIAEQDLILCPT